jgi:hypothetical protein
VNVKLQAVADLTDKKLQKWSSVAWDNPLTGKTEAIS